MKNVLTERISNLKERNNSLKEEFKNSQNMEAKQNSKVTFDYMYEKNPTSKGKIVWIYRYKVTHNNQMCVVEGRNMAYRVLDALRLGVDLETLRGLGGLQSYKKCGNIIKNHK